MKKILFLNKAPPYQNTGAEQVVWEVGQHLAAHSWDVHFLTPDRDGSPDVDNVTFHKVATPDSFFAEKAAFFLKGAPEYLRLRNTLDPDLIYDNASPFPFLYAHLLDRDRLVTKVHAVYGKTAFQNKHHPITKVGTFAGEQLYRVMNGNKLLTVSESTKQRLQKRVRRNPAAITVVENGINVDEFDYRFNPEGPILSLSALTPRKNVASLLRAWSQLEASGEVDRELVIAGDGPQRKALEDLAADLSLSSMSFRGYVPEDKKPLLLRDAFCYVLPTQMEGFGLTNLEAMASGCVTVSTDTPGVRDYLVDGTNGRMVPPNDPDALAATLSTLLNNSKSQEPLVRHGRETAKQYDRSKTLDQERKVLEQLLEHQK